MSSHCFAAFAVMSTSVMILQVNGQCTLQGCEFGGSSTGIVTEIQEMRIQQDAIIQSLKAVDRRSQEQGIDIKQVQNFIEFLNESFHEIKIQQIGIMASLQASDGRSKKQVQSMQAFVNASLQRMYNQQENAMLSLQSVERRSQEQEISSKHVRNTYELLNASDQHFRNQNEAVVSSLGAFEQRLNEHDMFFKNQTQSLWKLAAAFGTNDWIMLMHRFDGSLNFYRGWSEYRNGFGDVQGGEFWLGNERMHTLTNRFFHTLRIEVQFNTSREWYYAEYSTFSIDSEDNKYAIHLSGFSGNAGDGLTNSTFLGTDFYHDGMYFSTWDKDNDKYSGNCANGGPAGWWFNACFCSCLTCAIDRNYKWHASATNQTSYMLRSARMLIKAK